MGFQIESGTGTGKRAAVSSDNRLDVSARSTDRVFYSSRDDEDAYMVHSFDAAAAVGEYTLYFKNISTSKIFVVSEIIVNAGVAMTIKISTVTGTATGTPIIPFNLNVGSGKSADALAFGDAAVGGLTEAINFLTFGVGALETHHIEFHEALILGQDDAIALECDVNAGGLVYMHLFGHFEGAGQQ